MAKDYFQDIIPPGDGSTPPRPSKPRPLPPDQPEAPKEEDAALNIPIQVADAGTADERQDDAPPRGIRNIPAPPRQRPMRPPETPSVVAGLLFFFGSTTITVTPKSRTAVLTSAPLVAKQGAAASEGELSYTMQTFDLEDSEVVAAKGTTRVESKASGSIVVENAYSATPLTFVKNTRFESPQGLIYHALSDVVVPGKKGSTPGTVSITVVAAEPGEKYNIGPTAKFTLPGLKTNAAMYAAVSAKSGAAMSGGAAGGEPGTEPGAREAAVALVRGRLEVKAREAAAGQAKDDVFVFPELIVVTYESLPTTKEAGDSVRIHEKARRENPASSISSLPAKRSSFGR